MEYMKVQDGLREEFMVSGKALRGGYFRLLDSCSFSHLLVKC